MFVVYAMLAYLAGSLVVAAIVLRRTRARHGERESFLGLGGGIAADAHPLHRTSLRGRRLRFYRSPLAGPDFPWAVLRDLFDIATKGARYDISSEWIYASNPGLAQAVATTDGPELLVSHWAALELLATLSQDAQGGDPAEQPSLIDEFRESTAEAYVLQWAGMSREEFLALCDIANRRPRSRHL